MDMMLPVADTVADKAKLAHHKNALTGGRWDVGMQRRRLLKDHNLDRLLPGMSTPPQLCGDTVAEVMPHVLISSKSFLIFHNRGIMLIAFHKMLSSFLHLRLFGSLHIRKNFNNPKKIC